MSPQLLSTLSTLLGLSHEPRAQQFTQLSQPTCPCIPMPQNHSHAATTTKHINGCLRSKLRPLKRELRAHSQKFSVIISSGFTLPPYFSLPLESQMPVNRPPSILQKLYSVFHSLPLSASTWIFSSNLSSSRLIFSDLYPVCDQTLVLSPAPIIAVATVRKFILVLHGSLISAQSLHLLVNCSQQFDASQ